MHLPEINVLAMAACLLKNICRDNRSAKSSVCDVAVCSVSAMTNARNANSFVNGMAIGRLECCSSCLNLHNIVYERL